MTCSTCHEAVPDIELEDGVCVICRSIQSLKKTLEDLGKVRRHSEPIKQHNQLPPSDRE